MRANGLSASTGGLYRDEEVCRSDRATDLEPELDLGLDLQDEMKEAWI